MRLLVVSNRYPPDVSGGYELRCAATVDALRHQGHHVEVLTIEGSHDADPHVHRELRRHRDPTTGPARRLLRRRARRLENFEWHLRRSATMLRNHRRSRRFARGRTYDLVLCWGVVGIGLATLAPFAGRVPILFVVGDFGLARMLHIHRPAGGLAPERWPTEVGDRAGRVVATGHQRWAYAAVLWLARGVRFERAVFASDFLRRSYQRLGHHPPVGATVPLGVRFEPPPVSSLPEPDRHHLVYFGRVDATKGVHLAVEALARLRNEHGLPARLTIIGRGPSHYDEALRAQTERLGLTPHVTRTGWMDGEQLYSLLPRFRCFVFPAVWPEPAGMTQLEAMGHGVPVVASSTGGLPETVRHGVDGLLVDPDDVAALAGACARLIDDDELWGEMRANGVERVRTAFSSSQYVANMAQCVLDAVPTPRGGAAR